MQAREFCRRWFKATPEQEMERGYREKCVNLLSQILKVRPNTIQRWGKGLDLKTPESYAVTLAYADIIRELIEATHQGTDLLKLVLENLDN
jgi:hypothetical protein